MKHKCKKCENSAIWYYLPYVENYPEENKYFCDDCISRGCSCNLIPGSEVEDTDEQGRLLPCCEYKYNCDGFSDDDDEDFEIELWDQALLDGLELEE